MTIILLAAGASTRLGRPKQLLNIKGVLLINRILGQCLESKASAVQVVLGAYANQITAAIAYPNISICVNKNWKKGMASSLQTGLQAVLESNPKTSAVLVVLVDQYFVDAPLLDSLIHDYTQSTASAACCSYKGTIGVPAVFSATLFENLLDNKEQGGAKRILLALQKQQQLNIRYFPNGQYDIDTEAGLEALIKRL